MTAIDAASRPASRALAISSNVRWVQVAPTLLVVWTISMFDKSNMPIVLNDSTFLNDFGLVGQQAKFGLLGTGLFIAYGVCAPIWGLLVALVASWFPLRERGRATSFWWIGTMIGPMLVGLVVTSLIVAVGWRWQFHQASGGFAGLAVAVTVAGACMITLAREGF